MMIVVHRAKRSGRIDVEDLTIRTCEPIADPAPGDNGWRAQLEHIFEVDSEALYRALYRTLPGGTFDRLLGKMLARKASHFMGKG